MRYVFYTFALAAAGLAWMNTTDKGQSVKRQLFASHTPEWKAH